MPLLASPAERPDLDRTGQARPWYGPAFVALLVAVLIITTPMSSPMSGLWGSAWAGSVGAGWLVMLMLARASVVAGVVLARRRTAWATALVAWPFLFSPVIGFFEWAWWLALLCVAVLAAVDGPRRALLPFGCTLAVAIGYCLTRVPAMLPIGPVTATSPNSDDVWISLVIYVLASSAAVAIAVAIGMMRRSKMQSVVAAADSNRAREVATIAGERARLARDLHDVVAHHISLVAVRAESAPFMHPQLGEAARTVLADIARDARGALDELRHVLVVLQRTEEQADTGRSPQPGADGIAKLVDDARAAGQDVHLTWSGERHVAAAQGYVMFRAIQEALTNARRHAPGSAVDVVVTVTDAAVTVRICNPVDPQATSHDPGNGLVGMRERVEALGGDLQVDNHDGTFRVVVDLPIAPAADGAVGETLELR
ncbi:sensor histidine kinase [Pengzhenrongella sicca]|uniref:histidine kinase n=1 Tax=Pengzhenrongella sicca TaxID=2819238 RepID=A0A8A4ZAY6_9MICO|nr:histidine kinase [Pengzhenrongella sicca]QTE28585.1 hypothetical protein J4E96_14600 [Pengzhenrongella sicca]